MKKASHRDTDGRLGDKFNVTQKGMLCGMKVDPVLSNAERDAMLELDAEFPFECKESETVEVDGGEWSANQEATQVTQTTTPWHFPTISGHQPEHMNAPKGNHKTESEIERLGNAHGFKLATKKTCHVGDLLGCLEKSKISNFSLDEPFACETFTGHLCLSSMNTVNNECMRSVIQKPIWDPVR